MAFTLMSSFLTEIERQNRPFAPPIREIREISSKNASTAYHVDMVFLIFEGKVCPKRQSTDPTLGPCYRDFTTKKCLGGGRVSEALLLTSVLARTNLECHCVRFHISSDGFQYVREHFVFFKK